MAIWTVVAGIRHRSAAAAATVPFLYRYRLVLLSKYQQRAPSLWSSCDTRLRTVLPHALVCTVLDHGLKLSGCSAHSCIVLPHGLMVLCWGQNSFIYTTVPCIYLLPSHNEKLPCLRRICLAYNVSNIVRYTSNVTSLQYCTAGSSMKL